MTWRCPACQTSIRHRENDLVPMPGARYRCHVCRIELTLNPDTDRLDVTPTLEPSTEQAVDPKDLKAFRAPRRGRKSDK